MCDGNVGGNVVRQYTLLWSSLFMLLACTAVAQDCASIIALSRVVNVIVSDKTTVEQHASRFCDEYRRYRQTGSRASFGASYRFLSFASGRSRTSVDEVASRYCSASSDYTASKDTYRQYTESIAPNSHSSYLQCMEMSERGLKFNVSLASILPKEFSLSVSFLSLTQEEKSAGRSGYSVRRRYLRVEGRFRAGDHSRNRLYCDPPM